MQLYTVGRQDSIFVHVPIAKIRDDGGSFDLLVAAFRSCLSPTPQSTGFDGWDIVVLIARCAREAKAQVVPAITRIVPVAVRRTAVPGVVVPTAATVHPVVARTRPSLFSIGHCRHYALIGTPRNPKNRTMPKQALSQAIKSSISAHPFSTCLAIPAMCRLLLLILACCSRNRSG